MKGKIFLSVLIISACLIYDSCKKYPDGPSISFHSVANRLKGHWVVRSVELNYENIMTTHHSGTYTNSCSDMVDYDETVTLVDYGWDFDGDSLLVGGVQHYRDLDFSTSFDNCYNYFIEHDEPFLYHHTFQFTEKKEQIVRDDGYIYTIDRLYKNSLHLTRIKNDTTIYTYEFER